MFRTRLIAVAALSTVVLPGCGIFCGDRCDRRRDRQAGVGYAMPVSFPGGDSCGGSVIPPGATIIPGGGGNGSETLPPPYAGDGSPRIPPAKIKENPGKQFELEKGTKGPVLTIPAIRSE